MSKISKKEEETPRRKVEGYMDYERNVFVVTSDPDGVLENSYKPPVKNEASFSNIKELLEKYKPNL